MKNFKHFFKTQLLLAVLLFFANTGFAQLGVKVPIKCKVVLAGAGGTLGYGGIVGDGGIVCMPDPFDETSPAGNFNITNIPVTVPVTTISSWVLKGDLSFSTTTLYDAALQSAGAVLTMNIESYNKKLRIPSEDGTLYTSSVKKWGRSKGTVRINYTSPPCNKSITFEVFKSYSNTTVVNLEPITWVPPIVGPDCVEPNKVYTFSVDQIASDNAGDAIGFDSYYWSGFPVGFTNAYYSADKSSVTFTTPSTGLATFTLACAYGRCNPFDSDVTVPPGSTSITYVKKTVDVIPVAPALTLTNITGLSASIFTTCLDTGNPTSNFSVAVATPMTGFTYTWSYGGGSWTSVISGASQQIITLSNVDNNPGKLTLKIRKTSIPTGCESVFNYTINRNFTTDIAITGSQCLTPGVASTFMLNDGLNNFTTWTLPSGWGVATALNGTSSKVSITAPIGTAAGTYTIQAKSTNCTSLISYSVNVKPSIPIITNAGSTPVGTSPTCVTLTPGVGVVYSCTTPAGVTATQFAWTYPSGWSCSLGCNTANPTLVPGLPSSGSAAASANITVTAGPTGCSTTSTTYNVKYNPVLPNTLSANCWNLGLTTSGTTTLTVGNAPNLFYGNYVLTANPALFTSYTVNATTGVITLTTPASLAAGNYTVGIQHTTATCGNSAVANINITVANITMFQSNNSGIGNSDIFILSGVPSLSTIAWTIGGVPAAGTGVAISTNQLTISGNTGAPIPPGTIIAATITKPGGCIQVVSTPFAGTHSTSAKLNNTAVTIDGITISPNPNTGNFSIKVDNFKETAVAVLTDITGKEIATYTLQIGENKILKEGLSKGTYLVVLKIDGKQEARQIIIK